MQPMRRQVRELTEKLLKNSELSQEERKLLLTIKLITDTALFCVESLLEDPTSIAMHLDAVVPVSVIRRTKPSWE